MNSKLWWGLGLAGFAIFMMANGTFTALHPVLLLVGLVLIGLGFIDRAHTTRDK